MPEVYLGLGSNIGDKIDYLNRAIGLISSTDGITLIKVSSFYESEPQGYLDQDDFVNCVVLVTTNLEPRDLLKVCQIVEEKLNRKRLFRWGPRTIDVDILLYDNIIINEEDLKIPHLRMFERAFVMVPLAELNEKYKKQSTQIKGQKVRRTDAQSQAE